MQWIYRVAAGIVLALALVAPAFAAISDGKTPTNAIPIGAPGPALTGSISGSNAGAFAYYSFNYLGDKSEGTITLTVNATDWPTLNATGVNLYQNGALLATMNGVGSTLGSNTVTFSSDQAGPILAQVYNYQEGVTVSYQLQLTGVTPAPAPATAVAGVQATLERGSAANPIPLTAATEGTLAGQTSGSAIYYSVAYPGDNTEHTIAVNFWPNGPHIANAVFVSLYQDGNLLTSGHGSDYETPGQMKVTFASKSATPVLIQVSNYSPDVTIGYSIEHQN